MASTNSKLAARAKAVKILKKIPVFQGLKDEEYHRVMAMCSSTVAKEGDELFKQGDEGNSMYILLSGEIDINVTDVGTVHVMKSGEILGEIGLVKEVPRTAGAVAKTNCVMLQLYAEILHEVVKKYPQIGYIIMRNVARILADRLSESNKK
jgi:CRP-like cAMP-binding protein